MSVITNSGRAAARHAERRRRRLQAMGQWNPYMDAEPVRAHMLALRQAGMSEPAVARRLNIPSTYFKNLLRGSNGRPPGQKVWREVGEAVLAYWPVLADFPDRALIDPTGTIRRVRAMQTLGWSQARIGTELGQSENNFRSRLSAKTVSARFARRVAGLYDRLWTERPEDHGVQPYVADRVGRMPLRPRAVHGPLAWDEDTIDDPKALPATDACEAGRDGGRERCGAVADGRAVILGRDDRREVLAHLYEWTNDTTAEIAARLEMTPAAAERQWERMKERAAADGRRLWRRVYVPRERDLKQDELEEAA
jgi:hypothetical protein